MIYTNNRVNVDIADIVFIIPEGNFMQFYGYTGWRRMRSSVQNLTIVVSI